MKSAFKQIIRPRYSVTILAIFLLSAGGIFAFRSAGGDDFDSEIVKRGSVGQIVSKTGEVKPAEEADLSFAFAGRVEDVLIFEGDEIKQDQVLARLSTGALQADLKQAQVALEREKIEMDELLRGPTQQEIAVFERSIDLAEVSLANAKASLKDEIESAIDSAYSSLEDDIDRLFDNPQTTPGFGLEISEGNTTYYIGALNSEIQEINSRRREVNDREPLFSIPIVGEDKEELVSKAQETEDWLLAIRSLASKISDVLNKKKPSNTSMESIYNNYQSDVSSARLSVNSDISSLRSSVQSHKNAQASLASAQSELDREVAFATSEEIRRQEISIEEAKASVDRIYAQLSDATIKSPINGRVVSVDVSVGETASAGNVVISVISDNDHFVEIFIPEADIENIAVGDKASVTFDAYSDQDFEAEVVSIDTSASAVEGVPSFKARLEFVEDDKRIMSGMSADTDIYAASVENVLSVPSRAIFEQDGQQYVWVVVSREDTEFSQVAIETGLRGSSGRVEITSGLEEGDEVVTFLSENLR